MVSLDKIVFIFAESCFSDLSSASLPPQLHHSLCIHLFLSEYFFQQVYQQNEEHNNPVKLIIFYDHHLKDNNNYISFNLAHTVNLLLAAATDIYI